jgi:hypothetical protein
MGMIELVRFETQPGHGAKHRELHMEALERLRKLGLQAVALQPLAGSDIGSLAMSINYTNTADYVASLAKVESDAGWQKFYGDAMATGAAQQVETSLMTDLDPAFQPAADRPLGAVMATQWRARPGRMEEFVAKVVESGAHVERLGGRSRPMQSMIGLHPLSMMVATTFADLDAYASYTDSLATDPEWQAFWAGAMKDPTADLLRSGLYVNMSD